MLAVPVPLDVPEDLGVDPLESVPAEVAARVGTYDHDTAGGCG